MRTSEGCRATSMVEQILSLKGVWRLWGRAAALSRILTAAGGQNCPASSPGEDGMGTWREWMDVPALVLPGRSFGPRIRCRGPCPWRRSGCRSGGVRGCGCGCGWPSASGFGDGCAFVDCGWPAPESLCPCPLGNRRRRLFSWHDSSSSIRECTRRRRCPWSPVCRSTSRGGFDEIRWGRRPRGGSSG